MAENLPPPPAQPQSPADQTASRRAKRQQRTQAILRVLGLPGGLGVAVTLDQLRSGQVGLALLTGLASIGAVALAIFAKFFSELVNKVLDRIEERLEETTDPLAKWIVAQLEGALVSFWWQVTPQFRGEYYKSLVYAYRTYRTQGLKTPGDFSPDLDKVFVPLRITSKSLDQISPALIQRQEATGNLEIWDFLAESKREPAYQRIVIIGAPGSGKTTLLRHITLTYAHNAHRRRSRQVPTLVPVFLPLHKIREDITAVSPKPLPSLIVEQVKTLPKGSSLNLSPQWFESKLLNGQCLVMLDGLDEVADETQRRQVSQWIDTQMQAYPDARWILTSRPYGYRNAQLTEARTTLEVQSFNLRQMEQFLQRWYLQNEILRQARKPDPGVKAAADDKAHDLISRIKNYPPLAAMALNPLLLTMIATVHDNRGALPGSRVDLYDEICDVLLVRRQEAKGLTEPFPLKAEQKKSVLQVLALALMVRQHREFSLDQGLVIIAAPLRAVAGDAVAAKEFLDHIETVTGLLLEREVGVYQFAHLSFQEFLASEQIKEPGQTNVLLENIQLTWWHETIRLFAAKNDTTDLVNAALDNPTRETLSIAYDCAEEGKSLSPHVRQRLEEFSLESADTDIAQLAARVKLSRRLNQLLRLDDDIQIDQGLISRAEYQLFLVERDHFFGNATKPQYWFTPEEPLRPETDIALDDALEFCLWLGSFEVDERRFTLLIPEHEPVDRYFFRLPTASEIQRSGRVNGSELTCWTTGSRSPQLKGIRILRAAVPPEYHKLRVFLINQDWANADQETQALLQKAKDGRKQQPTEPDNPFGDYTPCHYLSLIDQLWIHYSVGKYGFGVQVGIWNATVGSSQGRWQRFSRAVAWQGSPATNDLEPAWFPGHYPQSASEALLRRFMECGIEQVMPLSAFEVVTVNANFEVLTVNAKGEENRREWKQARFFGEDLGKGVCLEMIAIPGGMFLMGSPEGEAERDRNEGPQHEVTVPPFFMGKYPVTQGQWRQVAALPRVNRRLNSNPSYFKGHDHNPVENVSWEEAVEFCERLSIYTSRTYRLPTEAEWEYACRAGTTTPFHFGEMITADLANFVSDINLASLASKGEYRQITTTAGALFPANDFGLYYMHGNVWEWCQDIWHDSYEGAPIDSSAWMDDGDQEKKLCRGGSFKHFPRACRSAYRARSVFSNHDNFIGFRVVCVAASGFP